MMDSLNFSLALFSILVTTFAVFAVYFLFKKTKQCCSLTRLLGEAMDSGGMGKIFFDSKGRISRTNNKAVEFIPDLDLKKGGMKLDEFWDYLFEHAVDCDESLKNTLNKSIETQDNTNPAFREVIEVGDGRLCLVEVKNLHKGGSLFILSDISLDKKREDHVLDLNKSNYRLQKAIESATNGILVSDLKISGNPLVFANKALCEYVGFSMDNLKNWTWDVVLDLVENQDEKANLLQALILGKDADLEISIKRDDGIRHFNIKLSYVTDNNNDPDLLVAIFTETTLLKQKEAEAFQTQKLEALGQLAAGVAHDFNNVLSIIDGFSMMAGKGLDEESNVSQYLKKIQSASKRGAALTKKMLTFSRHKIISREVIDLSSFLEEQKVLLEPLVTASIRFLIRVKGEGIRISASPDSMSQIIMNLVVNARDAMPDGGTLTIELDCCDRSGLPEKIRNQTEEKKFSRLSISDTGVGMDKKTLARVFDPFFSTKPQGKGTGLGMSIVYGLIQEMGGFLDVVSSPGVGTTISMYIPASDAPVTKQASGDIDDPGSLKLKGYTVLVAEDEPDLLLVVCDMLEQMELNVITASNGDEALLKQDEYEGDIDLLLSDVIMPEMNGVKLAELLVSLRPETKVVFMSGYPGSGEMAPVELPEDAIFIPKPVDYDRLARVVYSTIHGQDSDGKSSEQSGEIKSRWVSSSLH